MHATTNRNISNNAISVIPPSSFPWFTQIDMTNNPSVCKIANGLTSCACQAPLTGDGTYCKANCSLSLCNSQSPCSVTPQTCESSSCGFLQDMSYCTTSSYDSNVGTCTYNQSAETSSCNTTLMGVCSVCVCSLYNSISCTSPPLYFNVSAVPTYINYLKVDYSRHVAVTRSFVQSTIHVTTYQITFAYVPYFSRKLLWNVLDTPTIILSSIGLSYLPPDFFVGSKATFISLDDNLFTAIPPAIYALNATLPDFSFGANHITAVSSGFAVNLTALISL